MKIVEVIEELKTIAARKLAYDWEGDDCIDDIAGGNIDDAFAIGERDGGILLARKLLKLLQSDTVKLDTDQEQP